ncbi:MAG: MptD family putative ECF transporter S component [Bacillota bacterium]|nr:MptD family putative ECF transporter S component [Bacillota bacterium]
MKVKDFVTIGVFGVIYFVLMFSIGMMGLIPILFLAWPATIGILLGPVVMLFMAKVPKPTAFFIFGMLAPVLMFVMGHSFVVLVNALIFIGLAELCLYLGKYKSVRMNILANGFFSCWACGSLVQILVVKEMYMEMTIRMMGLEYADALDRLITWPHMSIIYVSAFVGGIIGGFLGKAMLKKHFERAGIVS